jgi:glycosyltransferase involved in cell wall biosynthesis
MTKILMLLQSEFPPDIRLEKEISALEKAGLKVTLLCNSYSKNPYPNFPFGKIIRIKSFFDSAKLNKIINFPLFLNPRLIYYSIKTTMKEKPDFIHAHDLPILPIALILKLIFQKKVIFDMHENYPQALRVFEKKGIIDYLFKNPILAEKLEKYAIKKADKIIVVVEENKIRLKKLGISSEKIIVVSNTVDLETFKLNSKSLVDLSMYENKYIILYSGTVSPERGLDTPLSAMKYLGSESFELLLIILGDGKAVEKLNRISIENKLENRVELVEWCGHEKLPDYISRANLCIIPQPNNDFINTTIPHKLFEYMAISKPVLVSDAEPLKRIVEETNSGLVFHSNDSIDFAEKVRLIYKSKINFGSNGRKAVEEKYNWSYDAKNLVSMYQNLT